jgi:hypothetical protein
MQLDLHCAEMLADQEPGGEIIAQRLIQMKGDVRLELGGGREDHPPKPHHDVGRNGRAASGDQPAQHGRFAGGPERGGCDGAVAGLRGLHPPGGREAAREQIKDLVVDHVDFPPDGVQRSIRSVGGHSFDGLA